MRVEIDKTADTINDRLNKISRELPGKTKRTISKALTDGVKIAKQETPRSGMSFAERQQRVGEKKRGFHLKPLAETVSRDSTQSLGALDYAGQIRYGEDAYYAHMVNSGTVHQRPQNFIRRTRGKIRENETALKLQMIKEVFEQ